MDILFKKTQSATGASAFTFDGLGIKQCYVKSVDAATDHAAILRRKHHHASYEVHILLAGSQEYEVGDERRSIHAGELLLIAPFVRHVVLNETEDYRKRAVCFMLGEESCLLSALSSVPSFAVARIGDRLLSCLTALEEERAGKDALSEGIAEALAIECVLLILRLVGAKAMPRSKAASAEDVRVMLAKQYIKDNVQKAISLPEIASYCCIGEKQLSRLFLKAEQCRIFDYIRTQRVKEIERLLENEAYSLRQISEIMNFHNEFYFNAFFKKYAGMTPGVYRRIVLKR